MIRIEDFPECAIDVAGEVDDAAAVQLAQKNFRNVRRR